MNYDTPPESGAIGPTLYLESDRIDRSEPFCTEVFETAESGEYRVVQLTSSQSLESLRDSLDLQMEDVRDPSGAAVIMAAPGAEPGSATTNVGRETPLYAFRVDPHDLTGISVAFSRLIDRWERSEGAVRICLRDVESLLPYHETDLVYRFLNTVLATLQGSGADVHVHLRPALLETGELELFESLFDRVVEAEPSPAEPIDRSEQAGDEKRLEDEERPAGEKRPEDEDHPDDGDRSRVTTPEDRTVAEEADFEFVPGAIDVFPGTMSDREIDSFLDSNGWGVLAFAGETPYAIPMSYGYDVDDRILYMHIGGYEGSEKLTRLDQSKRVSFVVSRYERADRWRSVVVDGTLSKLSSDAVDDRTILDAFARADLASIDIFVRDLETVSFDWYVLEPEAISGRRSESNEDNR